MTATELAEAISTLTGETATVHNHVDEGGYGKVLWSRASRRRLGSDETDTEYIVHRWATRNTDRDAIPLRLYSGYYTFDEADARDVYERERSR